MDWAPSEAGDGPTRPPRRISIQPNLGGSLDWLVACALALLHLFRSIYSVVDAEPQPAFRLRSAGTHRIVLLPLLHLMFSYTPRNTTNTGVRGQSGGFFGWPGAA